MLNIKSPSLSNLEFAKELFLKGEVVAFPTETVYGLGANALDPNAVKKIFELKNRPSDNPLIVHIGSKRDIVKYALISNNIEKKIIEKLMPGPITIVLEKKDNISDIISSTNFVGIRIPSNQVALKLLQICKLPIAAPSANISGQPSPTSAKMVYDYFGKKLQLIIDGGVCDLGIESTVLRVIEKIIDGKKTYHINILRPGFITKEDIQQLFENDPNVFVHYFSNDVYLSPGSKYKHYSPSAKIKIIQDIDEELLKKSIGKKNDKNSYIKVGLILTEEFIKKYQTLLNKYRHNIKIFPRGSKYDLISCSKKLFDLYHICDKLNIDEIYIEHLKETGLGYSIMNRVKKSVS